MEINQLKQNWSQMLSENKWGRLVIAASVITNVILAGAVVSKDQMVVLPPPSWEGNAEISSNTASQNYKEAWGLFAANFIGNISPSNVDFVKTTVATFFSSEVYANIRDVLEAQADAIKAEGLVISFTPREVTFEPQTGKVFVNGHTRTAGRDGNADTVERTYELKIAIRNYQPVITHFDVYRGQPQTQARLQSQGQAPTQ